MKELVKQSKATFWETVGDKAAVVLVNLAVALLGAAMSRTALWGGIAPLGAALAAGLPMRYMLTGALGSLVGYILPPLEVSTFRYVAALLGVVAIRFIVSGIKPAAKNPIWSAIISAAVVSAVGVAAAGQDFLTKGVLGIAEGLLAGGSAYFIRRATAIKWNTTAGLNVEQTASLLIAVSLALTSVFDVGFGGVSLGRTLSVALILFSARYGRVGASAICGIAAALAVFVSGGSMQTVATVTFQCLYYTAHKLQHHLLHYHTP